MSEKWRRISRLTFNSQSQSQFSLHLSLQLGEMWRVSLTIASLDSLTFLELPDRNSENLWEKKIDNHR